MRTFSVKHATKETLAHLEAFMASPDFKRGIIQATEYEPTGGCNIELLEDGTWSIVPMIGVGNLYESPGVFIPLPTLLIDEDEDEAHTFNLQIHRLRAELFDTYEELIKIYGPDEAKEVIGSGITRCHWCRDKGARRCTINTCTPFTWWCEEHYSESHSQWEEHF